VVRNLLEPGCELRRLGISDRLYAHDDPHRRCDADGRCSAHPERADCLPDFLNGMAILVDQFGRQPGLVDEADEAVDVADPGDGARGGIAIFHESSLVRRLQRDAVWSDRVIEDRRVASPRVAWPWVEASHRCRVTASAKHEAYWRPHQRVEASPGLAFRARRVNPGTAGSDRFLQFH